MMISTLPTGSKFQQKKEDMSEALPCRSPNEARLNIQTNEVRAQNIFQHQPALPRENELSVRIRDENID